MDDTLIKRKTPKKSTFNETYYLDKFVQKKIELFEHLQKNPNNSVAKEQSQFISKILEEGKEIKNYNWPSAWRKWEEEEHVSKTKSEVLDEWNNKNKD